MLKRRLPKKKSHSRRSSRSASKPKRKPTNKPSARTDEARVRGLSAINLVRKGVAKSIAVAARAEGTTVRTIRRLFPKALIVDRKRGRVIGVKPEDKYSQAVEIVTDEGVLVVTARGSRERDLAGSHRAVVNRVLGHKEPPSSLAAFKGKTVGGRELVSDYERLHAFAQGGELDQLDALYVVPEVRS